MAYRRACLVPLVLLLLAGASRTSAGGLTGSPPTTVISVPADFATIQEAILAASDGDEVVVAPGVYFENVSFCGKAITVRSSGGAAATTINGSQATAGPDSGSVVRFVAGEDAASVLEGFTLTGGTGTRLEFGGYTYFIGGGVGCIRSSPTIRNCEIKENSVAQFGVGGGVGCWENAHPTLEHNLIEANGALVGAGGGICCLRYSSPMIRACTIRSNSALAGGGLNAGKSALVIDDCIVSNNHGEDQGGGIRIHDTSSPVITGCVVQGNTCRYGAGFWIDQSSFTIAGTMVAENAAESTGGMDIAASSGSVTGCTIIANTSTRSDFGSGGILCSNSSLLFSDCVVARNSAPPSGGSGLSIISSSQTQLVGCTVSDNITQGTRGAAILVENCSPSITRSIISFSVGAKGLGCIYGGSPSVECSNFYGNAEGVGICGVSAWGNFSENPLFCDPANGNYLLQANSCCLPGHHPDGVDCGLVGALGEGCPATPTRETSWGQIKAERR